MSRKTILLAGLIAPLASAQNSCPQTGDYIGLAGIIVAAASLFYAFQLDKKNRFLQSQINREKVILKKMQTEIKDAQAQEKPEILIERLKFSEKPAEHGQTAVVDERVNEELRKVKESSTL